MALRDDETIIREYFHDIPIMIEISRCESTFTHYLPDGSVLRGYIDPDDTGAMQINKRYHLDASLHLGLDIEVLEDNLAYARHLYETQGVQPWYPSQKCWGHLAMK